MFKSAIIGCGKIAGGYDRKVPDSWSLTHAGAYHLCPETELIAAADTNSDALGSFGEKWKVDRLYEDYREMLRNESVDILSICLPAEKHFEAFRYAFQKDIPAIFCEKPLSDDFKKAGEMVRMSEDRVVAVNYFRRWNSTIRQLREEIKRGVSGRVVNIVARYTKGILGNGTHLVDLMRWFFDEPGSFDVVNVHNPGEKDPGVDFILTFNNEITASFIHIPGVNYVFIDVDIMTENGRLVLSQRGQTTEKYNTVLEPYYQKFNILRRTEEIETEWRGCLNRAVQEIVDCLKNGGQTSCTPKDGFRALEICHAILSQSLQKRSVNR